MTPSFVASGDTNPSDATAVTPGTVKELREKLTHIVANRAVEKAVAVLTSWSEPTKAAFGH